MLEIERVKADEGRRLRSGTSRVRTRVRVREGRRQGADKGRSLRRVSVACCKHYETSSDQSRPSGSHNLAGLLERPPGEKRVKMGVRTESGCDKCARWWGREQGCWEAPGAGGAILGRPDPSGRSGRTRRPGGRLGRTERMGRTWALSVWSKLFFCWCLCIWGPNTYISMVIWNMQWSVPISNYQSIMPIMLMQLENNRGSVF